MDSINISRLDLNLLRTFVVLMEERNVSRASDRLHITQSAASNALERIREQFNDRILERDGRSMRPTRTAEALWPKISAALSDIEAALHSHSAFNPVTVHQTYSIGIDEYSMALIGKALVSEVQRAAPNVKLSFKIADPSHYENQLTLGEADILIAPLWESLPGVSRHTLFTEDFVGLMSSAHPLANKNMTLKRYTSYPHLLVSSRGIVQGNVDVGLRRENAERNVVMTTPWFESAARFLQGTELLLNMGRQLATDIESRFPVKSFELPVTVPGFDICMMWRPKDTSDQYHQWLRNCVLDVFEKRDG